MAGSVNKVILVGNLGADPEIKSFSSGGRIANLRLATSESWTDRQTNERRDRTEWHSVVIDNDNLIRIVEQYLRKGSKIYIEGQLRTRKWQDRDGNDRYTTEVYVGRFRGELTLLDRRDNSSSGEYDDYGSTSRAGTRPSAPATSADDLDDDVPF